MEKPTFDHPVCLRSPTRRWVVSTVADAIDFIRSPNWPRRGPASVGALKAMQGVGAGVVTRAEAREAFEEAAMEAHVLDVEATRH